MTYSEGRTLRLLAGRSTLARNQFDRIATEIPTSVKKYSVWLLDIATDEEPPHFLIRSVAKSALLKLVGGGHVQLDAQQSQSLQLVNSSTYARKKRKKGIRRVFHKYQYKRERTEDSRSTQRIRFLIGILM